MSADAYSTRAQGLTQSGMGGLAPGLLAHECSSRALSPEVEPTVVCLSLFLAEALGDRMLGQSPEMPCRRSGRPGLLSHLQVWDRVGAKPSTTT